MTTVNDFVDILRIIREQPEWGEALRSALLSKEVLELPQRLAEFSEAANKRFDRLEGDVTELKSDVAELKVGQARLEGDVTELKEGQARLEGAVSQLQGDVSQLQDDVSQLHGDFGNLRGDVYEITIGRNVDSVLGQRLGLRAVRLLKGSLAGNNAAYFDLLDAAEARGDITGWERGQAVRVDFIIRGRNPEDQSTVFVVVEASRTAGDSDIRRAAERSEIVRKATGQAAQPAVICVNADMVRQGLAQELNVTLVVVS